MTAVAATPTSAVVPAQRRRSVHTPTLATGTLIASAVAVFVAQMGGAIPAVLNGLFQQNLHTSSSQLTWISDVFLVPLTLLELTFGVLGDLFGRRRLLIGGSAIMVVGACIAVLTPSPGLSNHGALAVLWSGQAVMGLGAAILLPTSLAMIAAGTHNAKDRSRALAVWAAALSTGAFMSSVMGGLVTKISWGSDPTAVWRWAFVLVGAVALVSTFIAFAAKNSSAPEGRSLDIPGQVTIAVSLFALLFAVIQGSTSGWSSAQVITGFVVAVIFFVLFIRAENRAAEPLLQLALFKNRAFAINSIVTVIGLFSYVGIAYCVAVRQTAIQGFSPLKGSIAIVALQGCALVLLPVIAKVLEDYNPRWSLGAGFSFMAIGAFWLSSESIDSLSVFRLLPPLVIAGVGVALAISGVTAVAVNTVPNHLAGMAAGMTSQLRDFGLVMGPAVIGAITLSSAASSISRTVAKTPALQAALAGFRAAPAHAPAAVQAGLAQAVAAVNSGPLGANGVPATVPGTNQPLNPLKEVAFHALGTAYSHGFLICGIAAVVAAVLAVVGLGGKADEPLITAESLEI